jgi:hypothetical protein
LSDLKEIMDGQLGYESIDDSRPNPIHCWGKTNADTADDAKAVDGKLPKVPILSTS